MRIPCHVTTQTLHLRNLSAYFIKVHRCSYSTWHSRHIAALNILTCFLFFRARHSQSSVCTSSSTVLAFTDPEASGSQCSCVSKTNQCVVYVKYYHTFVGGTEPWCRHSTGVEATEELWAHWTFLYQNLKEVLNLWARNPHLFDCQLKWPTPSSILSQRKQYNLSACWFLRALCIDTVTHHAYNAWASVLYVFLMVSSFLIWFLFTDPHQRMQNAS